VSDELFQTVIDVVADTLELEVAEIDSETCSANTPVWDSLAHLMIINAVEQQFSIKLPKKDAYTVKNVGELTELVSRQVSAK
jgi:acyl carrier protein